MSRPIKFRVWCEKIKGFRRANIDGPKNSAWGVSINKGIFEIPSSEFHVVELFTGLVDKNGKEIYEGDIVKLCRSYNCGWMEKGSIHPISWNNEELSFGLGRGQLTKNKKIEIIGNIHENPELLAT